MGKPKLTDGDYFFDSERLGFRKFNNSDIDSFLELNADPEVMRYFPSTLDRDQTQNLMNVINKHIDEHGFGFFAVDYLSDKKMIGFIGLKKVDFEADFIPAVEIGWRLNKKYWNKGLATEGAKRCLEFAFSDLGLKKIYSFTPLINQPSERVMQKIGMKKINEFDHPKVETGHSLERHCLYHLTKTEFESGISQR